MRIHSHGIRQLKPLEIRWSPCHGRCERTICPIDMKPKFTLLAERRQLRQGVDRASADRPCRTDQEKWLIALVDILPVPDFQLIHIHGLTSIDPVNCLCAEAR